MSRPAPTVDPDVAAARPLAGAYYVDPHWLEREQRAIFGRCWQCVAHAGQLATSGDFVAVTVAGEPVVVVRDGAVLRAFHNVCRHRGGPLVDGCGHATRLTCRYHGWTYALDGRLLRAPQMDDEIAARAATLALHGVAVATWANLVFVNLERDPPPLEAHLSPLAAIAERHGFARLRHVLTRRYPVAANWKVYVDNYLEGYHLPAVHPGLNRELDFRAYVTELGPNHVLQYAPIADGAARVYATGAPGDGEARYWWLFPNLMLNFYQGWLQTNRVEPVAAGETHVHFDWFAFDPPADAAAEARLAELVAFSEEIQAEDATICAAVQRNAGTRGFDPGAYSARYETGVHRFHRLYAEWLGRSTG